MDWIDITILIIAIFAAPYVRSCWQWITEATTSFPRSSPAIPNTGRGRGGASSTSSRAVPPEIEQIENAEGRQLHELFPELGHAYEMIDKREGYFANIGPSFPPDPRRISSGPVHVQWDRNLDDFWKDPSLDPVVVDPGHTYAKLIDQMNPEMYRSAQEQWERTLRMVADAEWQKLPVSIGLCHHQIEGSVCAVHRWDATAREADVEDQSPSQRLLGRLQCWTDPSLLHFNPNFVKEHPEFDPKDPWGPNGDGDMCILEVDGSVLVVGCPVSHSMVYTNIFAFFHSHGENDWYLDPIDENTTPGSVARQMRDFSLATICDFGGCRMAKEEEEMAMAD